MLQKDKLTVDLPKIDYLEQDNTYTGSCGLFRYRIAPDKEKDPKVLTVGVYTDHCYEIEDEAGRVTKKDFEWSNDGVAEAEQWVAEEYEKFASHAWN